MNDFILLVSLHDDIKYDFDRFSIFECYYFDLISSFYFQICNFFNSGKILIRFSPGYFVTYAADFKELYFHFSGVESDSPVVLYATGKTSFIHIHIRYDP